MEKESWYVKARKRIIPNKLDNFLSEEEKGQIVQAIRQAESSTSGEIRVHIEYHCPTEPLERAKEVFEHLGMTNTGEKNGALIYIAVGNRKLAIIGDSGINDRVTHEFWQKVEKAIEEELRHDHYCQGICLGIELIGEKLKEFFPRRPDDVNELSDEPSFGGENR